MQKVTRFNFDGTFNYVNTKNQRTGIFEGWEMEHDFFFFGPLVLFSLSCIFLRFLFVLFSGME